MSCTWLKSRREARNLSQYALGKAVGVDERIIRRWENCEPQTSKQVPYAQLAVELGESEVDLAEAHARDLTQAGLYEQAERAREAADKAHRARTFAPIDPTPIRQALEACRSTGLCDGIAQRVPCPIDAQAQADVIVGLLEQGDLDTFVNRVNLPLQAVIETAAREDDLSALRGFLDAIVQCCAARDPGLQPGRWHQHQGEDKAWAYRAMIGHSRGLDSMRTVRAAPDTRQSRLDDGPDSTRAVRSGAVTQVSADGRLHQLVCGFADLLATIDLDPPRVSDARAFEDYCKAVNAEISVHNELNEHVFGLWEKATQESEDVKDRLLRLLPKLRLFDCGDPGRANSVMRVDPDMLEGWYAFHLRIVEDRRKIVASASPVKATLDSEQPTMTPTPNSSVHVNIINSTGDNAISQAGPNGTIHQVNHAPPREQALALCDELLQATSGQTGDHSALRKATRDLQGELEQDAQVSEPTKTRLQRAAEALPTTEKAVGIAAKLVELLCKLPSIG